LSARVFNSKTSVSIENSPPALPSSNPNLKAFVKEIIVIKTIAINSA
jgi:hypothetical protein